MRSDCNELAKRKSLTLVPKRWAMLVSVSPATTVYCTGAPMMLAAVPGIGVAVTTMTGTFWLGTTFTGTAFVVVGVSLVPSAPPTMFSLFVINCCHSGSCPAVRRLLAHQGRKLVMIQLTAKATSRKPSK